MTVKGEMIMPDDLPRHIYQGLSFVNVNLNRVSTLKQALDEVEKDLIISALERYGNTYKAAEALGISQSTFVRRVQKYR